MNILLTGGAGYVGSACLRLLKDSGHRVVAFDNLVEGHADAVDGAVLCARAKEARQMGSRRALGRETREEGAPQLGPLNIKYAAPCKSTRHFHVRSSPCRHPSSQT